MSEIDLAKEGNVISEDVLKTETLNKLKRERSGLVGVFAKNENKLKTLLTRDDTDHGQVDSLMVTLDKICESLGQNSTEWQNFVGKEEEYAEIDKYRVSIYERLIQLKFDVHSWKQKIVVHPGDSVSQVHGSQAGSAHSVSSSLVKVAARKAALEVKAAALKQEQELTAKQMELKHLQESLQLETQIEMAKAEEETFQKYCGESLVKEETVHKTPVVLKSELPSADEKLDEGTFQQHLEKDKKARSDEREPTHGSFGMTEELLQILQLPKTELIKFEGDPLKYHLFVRSFDNSVGNTSVDNATKLNRLLQYCSGSALRVIECCAVMPPDVGYGEARRLLCQRFGDSFVISKAWIRKITEGPGIKTGDNSRLRSYADLVQTCVVTLSAMSKLSEVDNQQRMQNIVDKLPFNLQARWRKQAVHSLRLHGFYPNIDELADFIDMAAAEADDPVFGTETLAECSRLRFQKRTFPESHKKSPISNFSVQTNGTQYNGACGNEGNIYQRSKLVCRWCSGKHPLYKCNAFKQMNSSKRLDFVSKNKLCFNCFSSLHASYNCPKPSFCNFTGCCKKHSNLLHGATRLQVPSQTSQSKSCPISSIGTPTDHLQTFAVSNSVCDGKRDSHFKMALPIVPVYVWSNVDQAPVATYALLDPGSTNTFCSQKLATELGLQTERTTLSLTTLSGVDTRTETSLVSFHVSDINKVHSLRMSNVFVVSQMPTMKGNLISEDEIVTWSHLKDITIPFLKDCSVGLLIGQDNPQALIPTEVRTGGRNEPFATKTLLGWAVNGPVSRISLKSNIVSNFTEVEENVQHMLERMWKLDSNDLQIDDTSQMSEDDRKVVELWNSSIQMEGEHYKLPIPFKCEDPCMPNNHPLAESRLQSLKRKLLKDDVMFEKYKNGIQTLLDKGYAEKIPMDQIDCVNGPVWYLPHHEKKPDKLRIVFDCSAKYGDVSLNSQVRQGPDLTNSLLGVLMRFREGQIAVVGDIEAMFHQVRVANEHRDALRFLWWQGGDMSKPAEVYRMTSHLFGGIWSSSIANFAVKKTAEDNSSSFDQEVVRTVQDNLYVDDCLKSVGSEDDAVRLVEGVCDLLSKGGFKMKQWTSNSRKVMASVPAEDRSKQVKDVDLNSSASVLPQERALGIRWNTETDEFGFNLNLKNKPDTRRGILSILSSVYDPLGFVSPVILKARTIFQDECRLRKGWDDPLEDVNAASWHRWKDNLKQIEQFSIERRILPDKFGEIHKCELHHFSDASKVGYGVVSYLRVVNTEGKIHCSFLMSKSRLAPIKEISIPRLELSAAVLSVKQDLMLRQELRLKLDSSTFWTDSAVVLCYIQNETQRYQTFVANRVSQIREGSTPDSWRHVKSSLNPADCASRGTDPHDLLSNASWKHGPEFLWSEESAWPEMPDISVFRETVPDIKKPKVNLVLSESEAGTDKLLKYYSSWFKMKKAVAWILRFKAYLMRKGTKDNPVRKVDKKLTTTELQNAETEIVKYVQRCHFQSEIQCLLGGRAVNKSSPIYQLDPMMNSSGILCVGGRLARAPIHEDAKHQMLLPKSHPIVEVVVRHYHHLTGHAGKEHVLAEIQQKYWILGGRRIIQQVLKKCIPCKRIQGSPLSQKMSQLPHDRVTPGKPPFTYVGVDCFGPIEVKRGRSTIKRYGCLFTCMTSRAIHIEKLDSMDTDSFISALRRFEARRGKPELMRSDNGTNFRGAEKELRIAIRSWNQNQIEDYLLQRDIQWKFNPPMASHMGGIWERQIRSVRKVLNSLICKGQNLRDEDLNTLFCEIESIINSRPITVVSSSSRDAEPLTPNHLLLLRSSHNMPPGVFCLADVYRRRWRHIQFLADVFWKRWLQEYLPTLQKRQKWQKSVQNVSEGDIVLMIDYTTPRHMWPIGRILKLLPGADGFVRSVEVKSRNGVYTRPIQKLCLLESVSD